MKGMRTWRPEEMSYAKAPGQNSVGRKLEWILTTLILLMSFPKMIHFYLFGLFPIPCKPPLLLAVIKQLPCMFVFT